MENIKNKLKAELSAYGRVEDCVDNKYAFILNYRYGGNVRVEVGRNIVTYRIFSGKLTAENYLRTFPWYEDFEENVNKTVKAILRDVVDYKNKHGLNVA